VAEETPMTSYLNAHHGINNLRHDARAEAAAAAAAGPPAGAPAAGAGQGPRVVVAGPTDVGKSTLCRLLLNWGVRAGAAPTYVDLDVGQGTVTAPGCLAATPIETPVDVEEGYPVQARRTLRSTRGARGRRGEGRGGAPSGESRAAPVWRLARPGQRAGRGPGPCGRAPARGGAAERGAATSGPGARRALPASHAPAPGLCPRPGASGVFLRPRVTG
jgi:hypothetical protein